MRKSGGVDGGGGGGEWVRVRMEVKVRVSDVESAILYYLHASLL